MTTGNFWNVSNPNKPTGDFDPDGVYDLSFDWAAWLAGLTDTYASHVIEADDNLEVVASSEATGVITVRVRKASAGVLVVGQKCAILCRITTALGQVEDQTVYLKVREK